jgi:hypothetical protein
MPAPGKYPDQMRERAIRLVPGVVGEAGNVTAACRRIGEELGINADTLHGWVGGDGTVRVWRLADGSPVGERGHDYGLV